MLTTFMTSFLSDLALGIPPDKLPLFSINGKEYQKHVLAKRNQITKKKNSMVNK